MIRLLNKDTKGLKQALGDSEGIEIVWERS